MERWRDGKRERERETGRGLVPQADRLKLSSARKATEEEAGSADSGHRRRGLAFFCSRVGRLVRKLRRKAVPTPAARGARRADASCETLNIARCDTSCPRGAVEGGRSLCFSSTGISAVSLPFGAPPSRKAQHSRPTSRDNHGVDDTKYSAKLAVIMMIMVISSLLA